jgi:hypothetical protein
VLLLPDVRAVELYRRDAIGWTDEWRVISQDLEEVLANDDMSLLARSRQAQRAFDRAVALARDVDAAEAPPALLGLHELSVSTSGAYVEAGAAIARWLSAPSDENQVAAEEALANANAALSAIETNAWIGPLDEDAPE